MEWAKGGFLGGFKGHVGKIGEILSEYEEEREAESARTLRRERMAKKAQEESAVQEEEDDSDECGAEAGPEPSDKEKKRAFERLLREQFIAGRVDVSVHSPVYHQDTYRLEAELRL